MWSRSWYWDDPVKGCDVFDVISAYLPPINLYYIIALYFYVDTTINSLRKESALTSKASNALTSNSDLLL